MQKRIASFFLLSSVLLSSPLPAVTITATDAGLLVDGISAWKKQMIDYPQLMAGGKEVHKIIEKTASGNTAVLKYEGGGQADITGGTEGKLSIKFTGVGADVKNIAMKALLPFGLSEGGTWKFDAGAATPFPAPKQPKPHLFQGAARTATFFDTAGHGLAVEMPSGTYHELIDNREWNWKTYYWKFSIPFNPEIKLAFTRPPDAEGAALIPKVKVDPFGQSNKRDWPAKVKTAEELKADAAEDEAYYASFTPPETDRYGGYPGSGEKLGLKKTGFFHVEKTGGRWVMVDPDGNAFFHLGMGGFALPFWTYVKGRQDIYEWLPPFESEYKSAYLEGSNPDSFSFYCANWIRKYGKPFDQEEFTTEMIRRVRKWGFNSNGFFSGKIHKAYAEQNFPYVSGLGMSDFPSVPGLARGFDPFSEEGAKKFDERLAVSLAKNADNPLIIGYFMGNEPILEDIPRIVPSLKGNYPCKQRLVAMLREKYGSIEKFNAAWKMQAAGFEDLLTQGLPMATPQAGEDMKVYTELFVDKLYSVVALTFRKYDKNHMLIGNRLQYGTINNEMVCRIMAKYLDVVSFNYYTYGFDNDFLRKVYQWTGKPMILSEFAWNAPDSGLGGPKDLESQEQRGLAYRNYVEQAAALGFVVGTEWYQLIDEPVTGLWWGKYSGPNGNNGMIAVTDRPWKKMVENVAQGNFSVPDIVLKGKAPFVYDHPLFKLSKGGARVVKIPRATGPIKLTGSMEGWPGLPAELLGGNLVQGSNPGTVSATFKVCWNDSNFYFWMHVLDSTPMQNQRTGAGLWQGDAVELYFGSERIRETGMLLPSDRHLMLSAADRGEGKGQVYFVNQDHQPATEMTVIPDVDGKGYTLEAAIPFAALGFKPAEGSTILFDIALDDSENGTSRNRQFMWNGTSRNSSDRSGWGKAIFDR